jgi:hypothetical protein
MKITQKRLLAALLVVALVQLSCGKVEDDPIGCALTGGTWHTEYNARGEKVEFCIKGEPISGEEDEPAGDITESADPANTEEPAASVTDGDLSRIEEIKSICMVNIETINLEYLDIQRDEVEGNVACNARLVLGNIGSDQVTAIIATDWDNGSGQNRSWEFHELPPGGDWNLQVNETRTSQTTYIRVTDLLLVKGISECDPLIQSGQESLGEELATPIEPFTCP